MDIYEKLQRRDDMELELVECEFQLYRDRPIRHKKGARPMAMCYPKQCLKLHEEDEQETFHVCHRGVDFARHYENREAALWVPGSWGWRNHPHLNHFVDILRCVVELGRGDSRYDGLGYFCPVKLSPHDQEGLDRLCCLINNGREVL